MTDYKSGGTFQPVDQLKTDGTSTVEAFFSFSFKVVCFKECPKISLISF